MFVCVISGVTSSDMDASTSNTAGWSQPAQTGKSTVVPDSSFFFLCFLTFFLFWFSTTLPFLCPKAINRKQNIGKWSKKSYLFPYRSLVSWVTVPRTRAGCSGVLSLVLLTQQPCGVLDKARLDFSEICHLVLNPILLVSAGKLKSYGVSFCSGWGQSHGEMYCIV